MPLLAAAIWTDQKFHLKDLLATALSAAGPNSNPWNQALRAQADRRSRELRAADLGLVLFPSRPWAVISLATLLILTLGLLSPSPTKSAASSLLTPAALKQSPPEIPPPANQLSQRSRPPADGSLDEPSNRAGNENQSPPTIAASSDHSSHPLSSGDLPSTGGGFARTSTPPTHTNNSILTDQSTAISHPSAPMAAGVGLPALTSTPGNSSGQSVPPSPTTILPPWQSSNWAAAQASASQALQNNQIDPAYLDMVRDYFHRP